jgi:hypothetical protein
MPFTWHEGTPDRGMWVRCPHRFEDPDSHGIRREGARPRPGRAVLMSVVAQDRAMHYALAPKAAVLIEDLRPDSPEAEY